MQFLKNIDVVSPKDIGERKFFSKPYIIQAFLAGCIMSFAGVVVLLTGDSLIVRVIAFFAILLYLGFASHHKEHRAITSKVVQSRDVIALTIGPVHSWFSVIQAAGRDNFYNQTILVSKEGVWFPERVWFNTHGEVPKHFLSYSELTDFLLHGCTNFHRLKLRKEGFCYFEFRSKEHLDVWVATLQKHGVPVRDAEKAGLFHFVR